MDSFIKTRKVLDASTVFWEFSVSLLNISGLAGEAFASCSIKINSWEFLICFSSKEIFLSCKFSSSLSPSDIFL